MRTFSIALYLLILFCPGLHAQNYVAPPPLLPNPANQSNNQQREPVYANNYSSNSYNNATANPGVKLHQVKKGETLYRIARQYNVTVDDIKAWNYLQSDMIATGSSLSIGAINQNAANNYVPPQYDSNQNGVRSVPGWLDGMQNRTYLAGESLANIASYYGLTEARLRWMNNLGPQDPVPAGFILNVNPCLVNNATSNAQTGPPSGQIDNSNYAVSSTGQDFSSPIPKYTPQNRPSTGYAETSSPNSYYNYGTPNNQGNTGRQEDQFDVYASINNGTNNSTSGAVPNSYDAPSYSGVPNNSNQSTYVPGGMIYENGKRVHVVGTNDTLETIADKYKVPAERLRTLNNLGPFDVVWPNQKLVLE